MQNQHSKPESTGALIDIEEAAKLAKVCTRTIRNWQASRAISVIKLGRVIRLDRDQFLSELRRFSSTPAA
jgi:excisionase family DNA binding protein